MKMEYEMNYDSIRLEIRQLRKNLGIRNPKRTELIFRNFSLLFIEKLLNKLQDQDKIISELERRTMKKPRGRPVRSTK